MEIKANDYDIVIGDVDQENTVFLYFSYHCNFCRRFYDEVYPELDSLFIKEKKLKLILKLVEFNEHPDVVKGLQTVVCLNKYGKLSKLHELLLYNPGVVYSDEFNSLIDQYIFDNSDFAECYLHDNEYHWLKANNKEFYALNLKGTPTFVINNNVYEGYYNYKNFLKIILEEFNFKN